MGKIAIPKRWDGGAYPDGLAGEAIPMESRIIACCDAWNAMVTDRPYRSALPAVEAMAELKANAGVQFDPSVVKAFIRVLERSIDVQPAPPERDESVTPSRMPVAGLVT